MSKYKYNPGDKLGPNKIELLKRTTKDSRGQWKGRFICPYCGKEFETRIYSVVDGTTLSCGCLFVAKRKENAQSQTPNLIGVEYDTRKVIRKSEKKTKSGCTLWEVYCSKCNTITLMTNHAIKKKVLCHCKHNERIKENNHKKYNLIGKKFGKLLVLEELEDRTPHGEKQWLCRCDCGNYKITVTSALINHLTVSCGCSKSYNESRIQKYLDKNKIRYYAQWSHNDCRFPSTNALLVFDFYLPTYRTIIEYDGEQHFKPVQFYGGAQSFIRQKERDTYKNNWCKSNKYTLLRIPYFRKEFIEDILDKYFILQEI